MTPHSSMRGFFAAALHTEMSHNQQIRCLVGDLGYGMMDSLRTDYPKRFLNCGAAEQVMIGVAVGLSLSGLMSFCYSITPFLLARPFEWLRNYVKHERIPIRLVGSGLDRDYAHDGISHWAEDAKQILDLLEIRGYFPQANEQVAEMVHQMCERNEPSFIGLRR